eukprot:jgi/Bigna1/128214/aug1.6_g2922
MGYAPPPPHAFALALLAAVGVLAFSSASLHSLTLDKSLLESVAPTTLSQDQLKQTASGVPRPRGRDDVFAPTNKRWTSSRRGQGGLSQLYGMGMSHRALEGGGCLGSKPTVEDSKPFLLYEHDVTDYSLTLNWQTVRRADFYELQMRPGEGEWRSIFNGTGNFARKKNLSPGSEYEFRMRYSSNGNFSEFTEPLLLRTLTTELSVTRMSMPSADAIDGTTMRILWNKPARTIK